MPLKHMLGKFYYYFIYIYIYIYIMYLYYFISYYNGQSKFDSLWIMISDVCMAWSGFIKKNNSIIIINRLVSLSDNKKLLSGVGHSLKLFQK